MKLIRSGRPGHEKSGVLLADHSRVDVSAFAGDFDEAFFGDGGLAQLHRWMSEHSDDAPRLDPAERLGPAYRTDGSEHTSPQEERWEA